MYKLFLAWLTAVITVLGCQGLTVNNISGGLSDQVSDHELTELTITGTMDARDFLFITDELKELTSIDLSQVTITAYSQSASLYGTVTAYRAGEIPRTAFFGKKLTSVTLPSSVEVIGYGAFAGCDLLTSITLPSTVKFIDDYAFSGSGLTSIVLPSSVINMGKGAFSRCESLESATIDASYVGDFAFLGDISLSDVHLGPGVSAILKGVFNGCTALKSITFDPSCRISRIDDEAFINSGLESIDIQSLGVGTIGDWAFAQTKLSSLTLPEGMNSLGEGALAHNPMLTTVTFPGLGHNHGGGNRAPSHHHTVADVSDYAFADNGLLQPGDMLRNGVTRIGDYAFYNVSADIDTMFLPSTITYLGDMAMAGMTGMKVLKTDAEEVPALGEMVWAGVNQPEIPLITPSTASAQLYQEADQWKMFYFNVPDVLVGDVNGDGQVSIADVTSLIDYLLGDGNINIDAADVNGDGEISIADVTALIDQLLGSSSKKSLQRIRAQVGQQCVTTNDILGMETIALASGRIGAADVALANTEHDYVALQCEVVLPHGVELVSIDGIGRGKNHSFHIIQHEGEENIYTVIGVSMDMYSFDGNEGNIMRLTLKADHGFDVQNAEVVLANVTLVTQEHVAYLAEDAMARVKETSGVELLTVGKEIAGVRYINVAGQQRELPWDGVNIVVTTYTDGSTSTVKAVY